MRELDRLCGVRLDHRDRVPYTYRSPAGTCVLLDALQACGHQCPVEGCETLSDTSYVTGRGGEDNQRKDALFEHWYSIHMALGWCMRYPCPAVGCLKLFRLSRNLDSHIHTSIAAAGKGKSDDLINQAHVGIDNKLAKDYVKETCAKIWGDEARSTVPISQHL